MKLEAFKLERYFARHEFSTPYLLCSSDCESMDLGELLAACRFYLETTGREITLEYCLLAKVNDESEHANRLAAIARDLGEALGCYGHVRELRRVWSGPFDAADGLTIEQIDQLARTCVDCGATPVCLDHVKRSSQNAKDRMPLELGDVTGAGKAEGPEAQPTSGHCRCLRNCRLCRT